MRILFLGNSASGLYKFRYELIMSLLKDNNEIYLSCPYDDILKELIEKGCKHIPLKIDRHSINPYKEICLFLHYCLILRKIKPEIVLTYTIKPNIYGSIASSMLAIPYICTITGLGSAFVKKSWLSTIAQYLYQFALRKAKMVFFQNSDNMDFMLKNRIITTDYILVQGSGVNIEHFSYIPYPDQDEQIIFLFVGRLKEEKGVLELCQAARVLYEKRCNNIKILAIGFCESDFQKKLECIDLPPNIEFLGEQSDVRKYIANANAIILPSYQEGMSNALLEAASCGRPLIASDIPGCREIIDNYETGILVKPRDVNSIVEAILYFIALPNIQKRQMGIMGRHKVIKEFNRNSVVSKYKEIIYK